MLLKVSSARWKLRTYPGGLALVTQTASGKSRYVNRSELPSDDKIADMTERHFDALMRKSFHGEA